MQTNTAWDQLRDYHRSDERSKMTLPPVPYEHDDCRAVALPKLFTVRREIEQ